MSLVSLAAGSPPRDGTAGFPLSTGLAWGVGVAERTLGASGILVFGVIAFFRTLSSEKGGVRPGRAS